MPESVSLPLQGRITNQSQLERQVASIAKKAGRNLNINLGTNAKDIKSLEQPLGRITGQADDFGKSMEAANARVIAFGASVGIINAVVQSFKSLVSTTIEVEKSLAKINSILKTSTSGLDALKSQIFDIARSTEQTFDTVADAALELSRQGLSATEVTKRLNDALILSRLSGINAAEAVAGLTAAVNSFSKAGLTTGEVLNKISNAANQFAVSERDLIEGFKRSASVAEQAGVSIDELGGIITAVQQKTARGGAVIGNSFKTIFTRIGRADNLELLRSVGVEVTDLQGKILPATKLIENLSKRLEGLNDVQVRSITEKIGGGFQIAPLLAALSDYSSETSVAIQATEAFRSATDQAYQKNIILNQTLSAAINTTSLSIQELANSLGELGILDPFKEILNSVNAFAQNVNEYLGDGEAFGSKFANGILKGISGILIKGGIAVFGLLLFNLSKNLLKFGADSFKAFLGLNKEAEKLKSIQSQIVQTLLGDKGVREAILRIENSSVSAEQKRLQQAEFFNTALRERVKITSQLNTISAGIAPGIIGRSRSGSTKRAADGYLPIGAEQKDISSGVGGAPSSAKPVVIPNFAFGGGKKGTMVANSSEYLVPNFAGGGDAIFNQDMVKSMGLPDGAKKINAAGGYVPNYSSKFAQSLNVARQARTDKFPFRQKSFGDLSADEANQAAGRGRAVRDRFDKKRKAGKVPQGINLVNTGGQYILLVGADAPDEPNKTLYSGLLKESGKINSYENIKDATTYLRAGFSQVNVPTYGLSKNERSDKNPGAKNDVDSIEADLTKQASLIGYNYAKSISNTNTLSPRTKKEIGSLFNKGSLSGFAGSIFEASIASIMTSSQFRDYKDRTDTSLIDLPASPELFELFGVGKGKGTSGAEVKNRAGNDQLKSTADKLFKILVGGKEGPQAPFEYKEGTASAKRAAKKAASGYIPNYAQGMSPVEEAIQREKDAGVPINQIRINQDGKLRNSQNPSGIAVTNTRDEPTGAIPKNAARGFVPNFFIGAGVGEAAKANVGALKEQTESLKKSSKVTQGEATQRESSTNKMILLTSAAFGLQQIFGGLGSTTDGLSSKMAAFGEGVTAAIFTGSALSTIGAGPGNIIEGIGGSKNGRNKFGRSAKKSTLDFAQGLKGRSFIGPLSKSFTKLAPIIGKLVGFGARLIPIIGTAVTAFQLLNPILKSFGVDLGKLLFSPLKSLGQKLGFVDTEAEKAAKSINKFSEKALESIFTAGGQRNLFKEESKQFKNPEGKVLESANDILKSVLSSRSEGRQDSASFFRIEQRRPGRNQQFQEQGGVKKYFSKIEGEEIEISKKTFDSLRELGPSINKKVETALLKTLSDVDLKDLENNPTFEKVQFLLDKQIGLLGEGGREKLRAAQQRLELAQAQVDDAQPKRNGRGQKVAQTAEQAASEVDGNVKVASAKEEIAKLLEEILKGSKALSKQEVIANNIKKIKFDIAKIEAESFVNQKLILTNVKTQEEAELSYRNALKETAGFQRFNNVTRLKEIETERKVQQESLKSLQKDLGSDKFLKRVFSVDALEEIDESGLNSYLSTLNEISEASAENKQINTEDFALQLARISNNEALTGEIKATLDANQKTLSVKREELTLTQAMENLERGRNKFSEIQVRQEEARLSLIQKQFDIEQKRISDAKTLSDLGFDRQLEKARADAIGGGQSARLGLAAEEKRIGKLRIDANEIFDKKALTKSFQKTIIDSFNQAGLRLNQGQVNSVRTSKTEGQFNAYIEEFNRKLEEQQKKEIEVAAEAQREAQKLIYERKLANLNFKFTAEDFDTSVRDFNEGVSRFVEASSRPDKFSKSLISGDSAEGQGGNQNQTAPAAGNTSNAVQGSSREAERAKLKADLDKVIKGIDEQAQKLKEGITGVTIDVQGFKNGIEIIEKGVKLAGDRLQNVFDETGASATTFANLLRDVFNKIPEQKAQNLFDIATTADPDTLQRAALDQARIGVLEKSEGSLAERNKAANEFILLKEKEIALIGAADTATKIQLEYEYQINLEILELRKQIAEAGNTEESAELAKQIEELEKRKGNPDPGTKIKKLSIDGETAANRMMDAAIEGADQFINTISDGLVDAISKGESLGDVLRGAADDFLDKMAKQAVNNVIRQGIGIIAQGFGAPVTRAEGGMISGGSGMKDDVPALLMGGEYVMKKSAVQKYGPNFMDQLNGGKLPGYAEGGMVQDFRTKSGSIASKWTPRSDQDDVDIDDKVPDRKMRTKSGTQASLWTSLSSLDKVKDSELQDEKDKRTDSGVQSSDWTKKADLPNVLKFAEGGMVQDFRTKSGVIASNWTPKSDDDNVDRKDKIPGRKIRSESGTEASTWTSSSSLDKAKDSEYQDEKEKRTESGVQSSNWTEEANLPDVLRFSEKTSPLSRYKEYRMSQDEEARERSSVLSSDWNPKSNKKGEDDKDSDSMHEVQNFAEGGIVGMVQSFRTKSGAIASKWTPRSDQDDVDIDDKVPDRKMRTKSGTQASLWTALSSLDKVKDSELEDEKGKRTQSGVQSSDWTKKADLPNVLKFALGGMISGGSAMKDDVPALLMGGEYVMKKSAVQKYGPNFMDQINGGKLPGYALGGMISGGSGMKDDVPAVLMGGEYVMKKSAVQKYGPNFMDQINGGKLPGYAEGGVVSNTLRTESGVKSSNWTQEANEGRVPESSKTPKGNVRTDSGLLASSWTSLANYAKAQKTELSNNLEERNESGLLSSRWTPKADKYTQIDATTGRSKYAPSAIKAEEKEERTDSGVKPSRWTREADYTKVNNVASLTKEKYRNESGLEASRWTREASFDKVQNKKDSSDALFRANSGLITSDWTRSASIDKASGNTAKTSLQQTIDDRIKQYTEKSVPENIGRGKLMSQNAVPSMLTGGEYVVGKDAAQKFGKGFLDSLNEGRVQKFAKGGFVSGATFARDEEDFKTTDVFGSKIKEGSLRRQKGGGDFVIPGLYGEGQITGAQNMLDFSTQAFTSGSRDVIGGVSGASMISLEPESVRLTNFGRTRETPLQAATREAKGQAFELNLEYQQQVADYKQLLEDLKEQEKARRKAVITKALISLAGMGISAGLSGIGAAMGSGGTTSIGQGFLRGATNDSGVQVGGILNPSSYSGYNLGGGYATGGYVKGGSSDIDSVMAMLSGGEFVLNRAATERIGQEELQNLNSGSDLQGSEKLLDKLDELLTATRENSGEINITVNGGNNGGNQSGNSGGSAAGQETVVENKGATGDSRAREELGKAIKLKVLEVLREEKRLGGTLR